MKTLQGRVALVTGAGSGIGAAIARRLAAEGAYVACVGRTSSRLHGSVETIRNAGGTAGAWPCDIADGALRASLVRQVLAKFGQVDILVNNAAAAEFLPIEQVSRSSLDHQFETNVFAPLDFSQKLIPAMRQQRWGRIINISSCKARPPTPDCAADEGANGVLLYGTTKAALNRMTAGLAAELIDSGITANAVAPEAVVRTAAIADMLTQHPEVAEATWWNEEPIEAIAECVLALCEPAGVEISGQILTTLTWLQSRKRCVRSLDGASVIA